MQEQQNKEVPDSASDYELQRRKVQRFNLTSDLFFGKVMEDKLACQDLIRILTEDKGLTVRESKSQYSLRNLSTHSVVLDVLAETENHKLVGIEIHVEEDEDHLRRSRFDLGCIDVNFLEKGCNYEEIPDVYMIFITEKDFLGKNRGIYRVEKTAYEIHEIVEDGVCEFYVNLSVEPENEDQASLLRFIRQSDSHYQTAAFPHLADKVTRMKEEKEEVEIMCKIIEEEREEGRAEGREEGKAEGRARGREEGKAEGEERICKLLFYLTKDHRIGELEKVVSNKEYRERLFDHYKI